jgi:hypothetical protein
MESLVALYVGSLPSVLAGISTVRERGYRLTGGW